MSLFPDNHSTRQAAMPSSSWGALVGRKIKAGFAFGENVRLSHCSGYKEVDKKMACLVQQDDKVVFTAWNVWSDIKAFE